MAAPNGPPTAIAKILVVGDIATGKTSVIKRYVRNTFSADYKTTIGVDFALKKVHVEGVDLNVQLWDIAGQERFSGLSRIFYAHAVAAIVVFDLFHRETFDNVIKWKQDIDTKVFLPSGAKIPVILVGSKSDLLEEKTAAVSDEEIERFAKQNNFLATFKVSALSGANVKQACHFLIEEVARNNKKEAQLAAAAPVVEAPKTVTLGGNAPPAASTASSSSSGGCC